MPIFGKMPTNLLLLLRKYVNPNWNSKIRLMTPFSNASKLYSFKGSNFLFIAF